ncbi:hypothetical protein PRIPAC_84466 [Pristionchus pacificus]|uniref:IBR domain-containing protein n=1 Tax=Pristionchus pacificus TaxID=54126 RepID=A0A2A6BMK8_PRIPA|nr:hypothetical protein PRIPAC_84466 [Pristionchus pacificus]|eukprot:PDM67137.1 hypothetical protein PRIPAC_48554 [Pristionchus pacificus]
MFQKLQSRVVGAPRGQVLRGAQSGIHPEKGWGKIVRFPKFGQILCATSEMRSEKYRNLVTVENALSEGAVGVLQRCPDCNIPFEKNGGCNTMHCTKCNNSFPYAGPKVMSAAQRAVILQQAMAEAAGDASVIEELNKIE